MCHTHAPWAAHSSMLVLLAMACLVASASSSRHLLQEAVAPLPAITPDPTTAAAAGDPTAALPATAVPDANDTATETEDYEGDYEFNVTTSYPTLADALVAANTTAAGNMSILIAAVEAAGVAAALNETTAWTILAPTNEAFMELILEMNTTAEELLANTTLLVPVLSYHVIPTAAGQAALYSANLTAGLNLTTALVGAEPLTVVFNTTDVNATSPEGVPLQPEAEADAEEEEEEFEVEFWGATNYASFVVSDIVAGSSIIHVIDTVLVPGPSPAV